jgi:hypothetical protein
MIGQQGAVRRVVLGALALAAASAAWADGGRLRVNRSFDGGQVAVFTSPEPLRAGVVDVSVWVQNTDGRTITEADVHVRLAPRGADRVAIEATATREAATNKLFQAALVELPAAGIWDVTVTCEIGAERPRAVEFPLEVSPPLPALRGVWPWFSWPAVAVALFAMHRGLVARSRRVTAECRTARDRCG